MKIYKVDLGIRRWPLPVIDECIRLVIVRFGFGGTPAFYRNQHQHRIIWLDLDFQVHRLIKVHSNRVVGVRGLIRIRLVHIHGECKVTILSCKWEKKLRNFQCRLKVDCIRVTIITGSPGVELPRAKPAIEGGQDLNSRSPDHKSSAITVYNRASGVIVSSSDHKKTLSFSCVLILLYRVVLTSTYFCWFNTDYAHLNETILWKCFICHPLVKA